MAVRVEPPAISKIASCGLRSGTDGVPDLGGRNRFPGLRCDARRSFPLIQKIAGEIGNPPADLMNVDAKQGGDLPQGQRSALGQD